MLAAIRPDDWNFPLLLHVLGASILVGALITALTAQLLAWKSRSPADVLPYARLSVLRTLLFVAIPGWFLMRIAGEWVASKGWDDVEPEPAWLGIGWHQPRPGRPPPPDLDDPGRHRRPPPRPKQRGAGSDARPGRDGSRGASRDRLRDRGVGDVGQAGVAARFRGHPAATRAVDANEFRHACVTRCAESVNLSRAVAGVRPRRP